MECGGPVRLKSGRHKKSHFFHLQPERACRQHQKGIIHIHLQTYILDLLPEKDCMLEYRMPAIGRIADAAWLSKKIVFEIQCSPISAEEVAARNRDYRSLGWTVVWILHEKRFNQYRVTAAEEMLKASPYYFSNFNEKGEGFIYDQFQIIQNGLRKHRQAVYPVDLSTPVPTPPLASEHPFIQQRSSRPYYFEGDFYLQSHLIKGMPQTKPPDFLSFFTRTYLTIFRYLLEGLYR
jgi:competence protein CoiA